ncbi:MAG: hypothetical protein IMY82_03435 [Chloroflexi bacterium]|nr:hypothetical protein [Chloroflexota bacterium]
MENPDLRLFEQFASDFIQGYQDYVTSSFDDADVPDYFRFYKANPTNVVFLRDQEGAHAIVFDPKTTKPAFRTIDQNISIPFSFVAAREIPIYRIGTGNIRNLDAKQLGMERAILDHRVGLAFPRHEIEKSSSLSGRPDHIQNEAVDIADFLDGFLAQLRPLQELKHLRNLKNVVEKLKLMHHVELAAIVLSCLVLALHLFGVIPAFNTH